MMHKQQSRDLPGPIQGSTAKSNLKWIHTRKVSLSKCMREGFNHRLGSIFRLAITISMNKLRVVLYWLHGTCKNSKEKVPQATSRDT